MEYQLLWSGKLWTVTIPVEIVSQTEKIKWTYVQAYAVSGGSHGTAMRCILQQQYPGLGFGAAAATAPISVTAVGESALPSPVIDVCASEPGKSSPSFSSNNRSQRPTPPRQGPTAKYAGSGTSGPRRPPSQSATSSAGPRTGASFHRAARPPPSGPPKTTQPARNGKGGWLGSAPTKPAAV